MERQSTGENPEALLGHPLPQDEVIGFVMGKSKAQFLDSDGKEKLKDDEFSNAYLTPEAEKKVKEFRGNVDDNGVMIIRPIIREEFDVKDVIAGVQNNLEKVIKTARKTTQIRRAMKKSAT